MRCARCDAQLIPGKRFCHACGARVQTGCPSCGAAVAPGFSFCPDCGASLGSAATAAALPPPAESGDPRLRHLPSALADKLRNASRAAGERKRVTVLFCDLAGSTAIAEGLDPEVYREVLDQYLEAAFAEIYRYEGLVNQLAGDGMMALFGAPIAHEDEPERAIRAAMGIQAALGKLSERLQSEHGFTLDARIGINTGMVVAGTVGNNLKMDYTAIGDTTNLAARLQAIAAPGSILISDETARLVQGRIRLKSAGPFTVKGKSEPVVAHEVLGVEDSAGLMAVAEARGLTPFVGRDAELVQLKECFRRLDAGLPQIVSIVGPAGCGKSRLVYELSRFLEKEGATLFEARCSSLTQNVPYLPWTSMMQRFLGLTPSDPPAEVRRKVARIVVDGGLISAEQAPYLMRVLGVSSDEIAAQPAEVTKPRVYAAYDAVLQSVARRGRLVIVVEDLQWIDDASRNALNSILSELDPLIAMIVATHRPDFQYDWEANAALTQLRLRPLSRAEASAIVRARAGGEIPAMLEERLLQRAEGNPFFVEELTRGLIDGGALARQNGKLVATRALESIEIPATIQELIAARLDRLRPDGKRVAQVASVLGRQFSRDVLAGLLADDAIDVSAELEELERQGIIHRKAGVAGGEYRFGESFTRDVAYDGLLLRQRRQLHDRVGEQILRDTDRPMAARAAWIGYHFARGSDREKGVRALLQGAEEAERLPSYGDAMRLYREAWSVASRALEEGVSENSDIKRTAVRVAVGLTSASVVYSTPDPMLDEQVAVRGIEIARELDDQDALARLISAQGFIVMNEAPDRFDEGIRLAEEGVEIARAAGLEHTVPSLSRSVGFAYLFDGRFEDARRQIEQTMAELERLGHSARRSDTYMGARFFTSRLLYDTDQIEAAQAYASETHALAVEITNRTVQSASAAMMATCHFVQGRYAAALEWAARGQSVAEQIDNSAALRTCFSVRILARHELGERAAAAADLDALQRGNVSRGDLAVNSELMVLALLAAGETERARKLGQLIAARTGGRLRVARNTLVAAETLLASGPANGATVECLLLKSMEVAESIGVRSLVGRARLALARLALERDEPDVARTQAEASLILLEEVGFEHFARKARDLLLAPEPALAAV